MSSGLSKEIVDTHEERATQALCVKFYGNAAMRFFVSILVNHPQKKKKNRFVLENNFRSLLGGMAKIRFLHDKPQIHDIHGGSLTNNQI